MGSYVRSLCKVSGCEEVLVGQVACHSQWRLAATQVSPSASGHVDCVIVGR